MQDDCKRFSLLLISGSCELAAMLRQLMEQQGLHGEIRRMDPGKSAVALARRSGPYKGASAALDLVLFDFEAPNARSLSVLQQIAPTSGRLPVPLVLLTSPTSEELLSSGNFWFDETRVFAPTSLACFLGGMRQHARYRFLRALAVMGELGPILVSLPDALRQRLDDRQALSA